MIDFVAAAASSVSMAGGPSEIWSSIVHDFTNLDNPAVLAAFGQVLLIDLVLAGDNAIVVGALAAGLPTAQRRKVILIGIGAALRSEEHTSELQSLMRISYAVFCLKQKKSRHNGRECDRCLISEPCGRR